MPWVISALLVIFNMEKMPLEFFEQIVSRLKDIPRTGWKRNIKNPESVAAHSYGVAMLALLTPVNKSHFLVLIVLSDYFRIL